MRKYKIKHLKEEILRNMSEETDGSNIVYIEGVDGCGKTTLLEHYIYSNIVPFWPEKDTNFYQTVKEQLAKDKNTRERIETLTDYNSGLIQYFRTLNSEKAIVVDRLCDSTVVYHYLNKDDGSVTMETVKKLGKLIAKTVGSDRIYIDLDSKKCLDNIKQRNIALGRKEKDTEKNLDNLKRAYDDLYKMYQEDIGVKIAYVQDNIQADKLLTTY